MTKQELLRLVRLLSAIESWALSQEKRMPDYLHDDLSATIDAVGVALLGPELPPTSNAEPMGRPLADGPA